MSDVLNRTTKQYLSSVNTPDYLEIDWIINPDLSAVVGVPQKYWKISGDSVLEMNAEEKIAVDLAEANATPFVGNENYQVDIYNANKYLVSQTWYRDRLETGSYATKVKEILYTLLNDSLTQAVTNYYTLGGSIHATQTSKFYTDIDLKTTYKENEI